MGKIFYIMGKSSTGKDTIYKRLLDDSSLHLKSIVSYTTRPIRVNETDGVEYFFTDEDGFAGLMGSGKVVEHREYRTVHGLWRYFTVDDGQADNGESNYISIGTIESFLHIRNYFGGDKVKPVLITLGDGERLQRALDRERKQDEPKYEEMCRRFLADAVDFSEEKIKDARIERTFVNDDLERCIKEIADYIRTEGGVMYGD